VFSLVLLYLEFSHLKTYAHFFFNASWCLISLNHFLILMQDGIVKLNIKIDNLIFEGYTFIVVTYFNLWHRMILMNWGIKKLNKIFIFKIKIIF
jgi:hypothetical protein